MNQVMHNVTFPAKGEGFGLGNTSHISSVVNRLHLLFSENPLCLDDTTLSHLANGLELMFCEKLHSGMNMLQLAQYYKVTIRTIERWRNKYQDFPAPIDPYAKTLYFPTDKVVEWKYLHPTLF